MTAADDTNNGVWLANIVALCSVEIESRPNMGHKNQLARDVGKKKSGVEKFGICSID